MQHIFFSNTAISKPCQNSFIKITLKACGIFFNLNGRQYLVFKDQLKKKKVKPTVNKMGKPNFPVQVFGQNWYMTYKVCSIWI